MTDTNVSIEPWSAADRPLLDALLGVPEMMTYLGGPESKEKLDERQARYVNNPQSLRIVVDGEAVGWVGYWDAGEPGALDWETGWSVRREFQGRGIATAAMNLVLQRLRRDGSRRYVHATVDTRNDASNALCRKLGFENLGEIDYEYPPGNPVHGYDWRLDLAPERRTHQG
jgi:RimJ/RimL family protein N-acetyltransferase